MRDKETERRQCELEGERVCVRERGGGGGGQNYAPRKDERHT